MRQESEKALLLLNQPNVNFDSLSSVLNRISTRMSFVSYGPIFEEMKYSGNLSLIKSIPLKNSLTQLYEEMDYISFVISENNDRFMDGLILFLMENPFSDYGLKTNSTLRSISGEYDAQSFKNAHSIQAEMLSDDKMRFKLHNNVANRVSVTAVHVRLYSEFLEETKELEKQIHEELVSRRKKNE